MGSIVTAQTVTVAGGNLFAIAAQYLGDATQWNRIAALNGLTDPILIGTNTLKIPPADKSAGNGGVLGQQAAALVVTPAPTVAAPVAAPVPAAPPSIGTFTLNANATTTTVTNGNVRSTSVVMLSPQTPDAANDMATNSIICSAGQFVVTHASNSRVDRTFGYTVTG